MTTKTTASALATEEKQVYTNFRDFNNATFEGRVLHCEIKAGEYGEFCALTVATTLKDGEQGIALQTTSRNGILSLAKGGHLMKGRRVHITGSVAAIESHYVNEEGLVVPLVRPRLKLEAAQVRLGAKPRSAMEEV